VRPFVRHSLHPFPRKVQTCCMLTCCAARCAI
jgi:hypothetical protein